MGHRRLNRHRLRRLPAVLSAVLLALALAGCSLSAALRPETYTVRRGDSLSSIGAQYGIDWQDLAQWNHIGAPYRLRVGEVLSLDPYPPLDYSHMSGGYSPAGPVANAPAPNSSSANAQTGNRSVNQDGGSADRDAILATPTLKRTIHPAGAGEQGANAGNASSPSASPAPYPPASRPATAPAAVPASDGGHAQDNRPAADSNAVAEAAAASADEARINAATQTQSGTPVKAGGPSSDGWQWPASGSLIRQYDPDQRRQGIEIGGRVGSPVYAASSGTVVYSGSGLKGYGKLIIIKHDEHYLSAYGFNERTLVQQGQTVAAGAHIADMGLGPENKPMLHFEVRRDGSPIDPESVLPSH